MSDEHAIPENENDQVPGSENDQAAREMVVNFLKPKAECLLCSGELSFAVNRDWLDGQQYEELIQNHQDDYRRVSGGHPLTPTTLAVHFNGHVDAKGAAVNQWSKLLAERPQPRSAEEAPIVPSGPNLFKRARERGMNKLSVADLVVEEMIGNLYEMKRDIAERRDSGRTFDLATAMKEFGKLLQGLHGNLIKAAETDSKVAVNDSNIQSARILDFAMLRTLPDNKDKDDAFARTAEQLWFTIAVKHIVGRLDEVMKVAQLDAPMRAEMLNRIKSAMQGLDGSVSDEYEREIQLLRSERERDMIDAEPASDGKDSEA